VLHLEVPDRRDGFGERIGAVDHRLTCPGVSGGVG
jgi:hypothetical protein